MENSIENIVKNNIVYDWYSYIQDFPGQFVCEMLDRFKVRPGMRVLDPFCGHGTTLLTSKIKGIESVGIDVNPFCCFVGRVKTEWSIGIELLSSIAQQILSDLSPTLTSFQNQARVAVDRDYEPSLDPPNVPKLYRWMSPKVVRKTLILKERIHKISEPKIRNFFLMALASILREISNITLALNVTIRKNRIDAPVYEIFRMRVNKMIKDYKTIKSLENSAKADIYCEDIRYFSLPEKFDFIVTSPSYPNDIDYLNQTRLELFFLDFVKDMKELAAIKKKMIASDAIYYIWARNNDSLVKNDPDVADVVDKLSKRYKAKDWGWDYPKMVGEYFGDMSLALEKIQGLMKAGGYCIMVVGDAAFQKILVPADVILAKLGKKAGFRNAKLEVLRERRATSHNVKLRETAIIFEN